MIDGLLSFSHLITNTAKPVHIARDRGVFERGALCVQVLLRCSDALLDSCELAGHTIREFLFSDRRRRCPLRRAQMLASARPVWRPPCLPLRLPRLPPSIPLRVVGEA